MVGVKGITVPCFIMVFLLLTTASSNATDTRVETMGGSGLFLIDDSNIWNFPTSVFNHSDLILLSLGGQVSPMTPDTKFWSAGIFELKRGLIIGYGFRSGEVETIYAPLNLQKQADLFLAFSLAGNNLAFHIGRSGIKTERQLIYDRSVSELVSEVGYDIKAMGGVVFNTAFSYRNVDFTEYHNGNKISEPSAYSEFGFKVRGTIKVGERYEFVPILTFKSGSRGKRIFSSFRGPQVIQDDYSNGRFGMGLRINPDQDFLAVIHGSVGYRSTNTKISSSDTSYTTYKVSTIDLPVIGFGMEKWLKRWIAVRLGVLFRLQRFEWDRHNEPAKMISSETAQTFGLAVKADRLEIDFAIEPSLLTQGPYILSGKEAPLFVKTSIRFDF